ncbi:hypothetical protein H0H93_015693, partial [Arthromyces matolae]
MRKRATYTRLDVFAMRSSRETFLSLGPNSTLAYLECPSPSSPSWTDWGLTLGIRSLMEWCWNPDPAQRPSSIEIDRRLTATLMVDNRSLGNTDVELSPSKIRRRMNTLCDRIDVVSLDRILGRVHLPDLNQDESWAVCDSHTDISLPLQQQPQRQNLSVQDQDTPCLISRLKTVLDDDELCDKLVHCSENDARLLDSFQHLLDAPGLGWAFKRKFIVANEQPTLAIYTRPPAVGDDLVPSVFRRRMSGLSDMIDVQALDDVLSSSHRQALSGEQTFHVCSHIALQLLNKGYRVRAAARGTRVAELAQSYKKFGSRFTAVEVKDLTSDQFPEALEGVDAVIHAAAPLPGKEDTASMLHSAVEGTLNVVRQAEKAGIKRIVVTSSMVTVLNPGGGITDKDWHPTSKEEALKTTGWETYSAAKTLAEKELWAFADAHPH